jgi:uncharacterized membrane protein
VACLAVLVVGLVGLLLLNVNLERGAYLLREQQSRSDQLREQRQALREQLQQLAAPQRLAARATELGMVPAPNAAFQTTSGKRLGVATPAEKPPSPTVSKSPRSATSSGTSAQPSAAGRTASGTRSADAAARTAKPSGTRTAAKRGGAQAGGGTAGGTPAR